nr:GNAT family N-acetyltransferase [Candidatus Sigynarchaeota archaeon]
MMDEVRACINSNYDLYKSISDPRDMSEHQVGDAWVERNFKIREFYLLRDDSTGQFIGAGSFQVLGTFAYIGYFYIKNNFQRKGYGPFLMKFLEQHAIDSKKKDLRLFVHEKATWARKFYEKMGFVIYSSNKHEILSINKGILVPFYEEGSLLMKKKL